MEAATCFVVCGVSRPAKATSSRSLVSRAQASHRVLVSFILPLRLYVWHDTS